MTDTDKTDKTDVTLAVCPLCDGLGILPTSPWAEFAHWARAWLSTYPKPSEADPDAQVDWEAEWQFAQDEWWREHGYDADARPEQYSLCSVCAGAGRVACE